MDTKNLAYIGIGVVVIMLGFIIVLSRLFKITKSFVSLMEIFTQFSELDIKKTTRYCSNLEQMFIHLNRKYDQFK